MPRFRRQKEEEAKFAWLFADYDNGKGTENRDKIGKPKSAIIAVCTFPKDLLLLLYKICMQIIMFRMYYVFEKHMLFTVGIRLKISVYFLTSSKNFFLRRASCDNQLFLQGCLWQVYGGTFFAWEKKRNLTFLERPSYTMFSLRVLLPCGTNFIQIVASH